MKFQQQPSALAKRRLKKEIEMMMNLIETKTSIGSFTEVPTETYEMDTSLLELINSITENSNLLRGVDRTNLKEYRKSAVKEYMSFMKGFTPSEKAQLIVDYASGSGWCDHFIMTGTKLDNMAKGIGNIPAWVVNSAFELLLERGWRPRVVDSDNAEVCQRLEDIFALFINYWISKKGPFLSVEQVLGSLPKSVDLARAEKWTSFFACRLGRKEGLGLLCCITAPNGERISEDFKSFKALAEASKEIIKNTQCRVSFSYPSR
ncbi:hypothetical protein A3741_07530 [Oleiphilus sp. HI0069]|nr:hypothetical protein A3741_07530 [Oleiphilus sp. HI0069]KZZ35454.1 hypothetical protein A3756_15675 [Oleiphilus sp. HI0086]KZZ73335.1 hypothetical protein A3766_05980 [Oleiphilus sp. HI0132]